MITCKPNDTIIIRNIARSDGTVTSALPGVVLQDEPDLLVAYIPIGTHYKNNWIIPPEQRVASVTDTRPSAQRQYRDISTSADSVRLYLPGFGYSIGLTFDADWRLVSWYGNLEAPFVRTPIGLDTRDFALDLLAYPDGRWHWKDEAEFQRRLEVGIDSQEHQTWVRAQGRDFIERFVHQRWPFNAGWKDWKPAKAYSPLELPVNWASDFGTYAFLISI